MVRMDIVATKNLFCFGKEAHIVPPPPKAKEVKAVKGG